MKKLLCLILCFCFIAPVFAKENIQKKKRFFTKIKDNFSHRKQLEEERKFKEHALDTMASGKNYFLAYSIAVDEKYFIKKDQELYRKNGNSLFGSLQKIKQDFINNKQKPYSEFNLYIIEKLFGINEVILKYGYVYYEDISELLLINNKFEKLDPRLQEILCKYRVAISDNQFKNSLSNIIVSRFDNLMIDYENEFIKNKKNLAGLYELTKKISKEKKVLEFLMKDINKEDVYTSSGNAHEIYYKIKETNIYLSELNSKIQEHGRYAEKEKYEKWRKANNKKDTCPFLFEQFIYNRLSLTPDKNLLYKHIPNYSIKVLQSTRDGVFVTAEHYFSDTNIQTAFIETRRKYADGDRFNDPMILEYKGIYQYYNVLGIKKNIHKFRELTPYEIKQNYGEVWKKYYFYRPY